VAVGVDQPWPLAMLGGAGPGAEATTPLLWGLIGLSIFVSVIIALLVIAGIWKGLFNRDTRVERSRGGLAFMFVGLVLTTVTLVGFVAWTVSVMAAIQSPSRKPPITIAVTSHQWWWEAQYLSDTPSESFVTANEFHIPVGVPVEFKLKAADVIHSFWVPALGGKTDAIPGRTNVTWLEADKPGVYRGQCSEYCGAQHSHMAFLVIAQTAEDYQKWRQGQLAAAAAPTEAGAQQGERDFILRCGACHTVRGTPAGGQVGPDLTHLMSRQTIAAGELKNNVANLSGWIADPQGVKPGSLMPDVQLSGPELQAVRDYLLTLR
jgi:cytochrome c oxidase subunit 2